MIWIGLLVVSLIVNAFAVRGAVKIIKQNEEYENYFTELQQGLTATLASMKAVDVSGAFEAEDEVGLIFAGIKGMVNSLSTFLAGT